MPLLWANMIELFITWNEMQQILRLILCPAPNTSAEGTNTSRSENTTSRILIDVCVTQNLLEGPAGTDRPKSVFMRLSATVANIVKVAPQCATNATRWTPYLRLFFQPRVFWARQVSYGAETIFSDFLERSEACSFWAGALWFWCYYITLLTWWKFLCSDSLWKPAFGRD